MSVTQRRFQTAKARYRVICDTSGDHYTLERLGADAAGGDRWETRGKSGNDDSIGYLLWWAMYHASNGAPPEKPTVGWPE